MSDLSGVLTDLGAQLIEEAYQAGQVITLTEMGLGDGGGNEVVVSPDVTALVGEFHRQALDSGVAEDAALGGAINYVPEDADRGKWVRELGMYDDAGNLIVYGATPLAQIPINPNLGVQFIISAAVPIEYVDSVVVVVNPEGSATHEDLEEHERSRRHPTAEEGQQGMLPLATQEMVAEGDDHASALTPKTAAVHYFPLASYHPRTDSLNNQQGAIPNIKNKDMNTCLAGEFGLYEKATCTNAPPGAGSYFYCETKSIYTTESLIQIAWTYDGVGVLAWRNYSQNTDAWDAVWREGYDSGHKPTAADVGAAPLVHTHPGSALTPLALGTEDLDGVITPGFYIQGSNGNTSAASHYPELQAGSLRVEEGAGPKQTYHVYNSSRVWTRAKFQAEAWTPWAREYNTANKPTPDEIGAAPVSHSHLASQVTSHVGNVGTYALMCVIDPSASPSTAPDQSARYAGSQLQWANLNGKAFGGVVPGSWEPFSTILAGAAIGTTSAAGLFVRVA